MELSLLSPLLAVWNEYSFVLELAGAVGLFLWGTHKRPLWWLRYGAGIVLMCCVQHFCVARLAPPLVQGLLGCLLQVFVMTGTVYAACRLTLKDGIFCVLCGYAVQHCASSLYILVFFLLTGTKPAAGWITAETVLPFCVLYATVYALAGRFLIPRLQEDGAYQVGFRQSTELCVLVIPLALVLSLLEKLYGADVAGFLLCQVYAMVSCVMVLWVQAWQRQTMRLRTEVAVQSRLMEERGRQFQLSLANIDVINRKCHDLKHQMELLKHIQSEQLRRESIAELQQAVDVYDSSIQTGNAVLDTVLVEKRLLCVQQQVQLTCLADGGRLLFLNPMDLYVLFGNALDNALEAVRQIADPERRVISLSVFGREAVTVIQMENYFVPRPSGLSVSDGLPRTSKAETAYHGFGLRSIKGIAESYGGTLSWRTEGDVFILSVVFPQEAEAAARADYAPR